MLVSGRFPTIFLHAAKPALVACALLALTGCNKTDELGFAALGGAAKVGDNAPSPALMQSTTEWAAKYAKKPGDAVAGINYARHLRAMGQNDEAFEVLTKTAEANPSNMDVSADLGRAALAAGNMEVAQRELGKAEKAGRADWRTLSALGTLSAKQSDIKQARIYYEAALKKNPDADSVKSNLALSYALEGKADKAEQLMRQAAAGGNVKVRQNLALLLGVQGKFDESANVAAADLAPQDARSNANLLRSIIPGRKNSVAVANAPPLRGSDADEDPDPKVADNAPFSDPVETGSIAKDAQKIEAGPVRRRTPKLLSWLSRSSKTAAAETAPPANGPAYRAPDSSVPVNTDSVGTASARTPAAMPRDIGAPLLASAPGDPAPKRQVAAAEALDPRLPWRQQRSNDAPVAAKPAPGNSGSSAWTTTVNPTMTP